jgi:CRISPR-associated endonuclease/helicase Cas3
MEKILPSSNLYSHPDVLLEDHLISVSKLSDFFLSEKPENIKDELSGIARIISLSHDIGKATKYFQNYLFADDEEKEKLKTDETHHSLFSAVCSYYLAKEKCNNDIHPLFAYITVRRHHGNLIDVLDEISNFDDKDKKLLHKQLEAIDDTKFNVLANKLHKEGLPTIMNKTIISGCIDNFRNEMKRFRTILRKLNSDFKNYIKLNLLYSLLLDADKSEVVIKDLSVLERKCFQDNKWVDNYINAAQFPPSPLNEIRKRAYAEVISKEINLNHRIYSLNLPTGLGKTLIGLSFALKLKNELKAKGISPRIVYALPFLSIIDQNAEVFEKVIKANGMDVKTNILLKHHHLSEIYYKTYEDEYESDEAKILIEGWNSEIVITTFVQLFHTLVSNRNRSIRKFHKLANSIIILDEVQSIPTKYWLLMKDLLNAIANMLNIYIILSTATEPLIFSKNETIKLAYKDTYFKSLDRVSLFPMLDKAMTIEELYKKLKIDSNKSYLYIFNTISSAKEFFNLIKEDAGSITYLSTHITPKERLQRIEDIKNGKYKIVVSTQLVEAGVDIDFDIVIRDLAPLDCINQSAGRCNRNGKGKGIVKVVVLKDSNERKYSSYIYDPVLLDITEKILCPKNQIKEQEFLKIIEEYYALSQDRKSQQESRQIIEAVCKLIYDREKGDDTKLSISDFKLIDNDYPKIDVFIELDDDAEKIWKEFQRLRNIKDRFSKKSEFDRIKSYFYSYVISIPRNIANMPQIVGEIGYVKRSLLDDYYDRETGFIIRDDKSITIC